MSISTTLCESLTPTKVTASMLSQTFEMNTQMFIRYQENPRDFLSPVTFLLIIIANPTRFQAVIKKHTPTKSFLVLPITYNFVRLKLKDTFKSSVAKS